MMELKQKNESLINEHEESYWEFQNTPQYSFECEGCVTKKLTEEKGSLVKEHKDHIKMLKQENIC